MQAMWIHRFWLRNGLALAGLLVAVYLPDIYAIQERSGWTRWTPYGFLLLLYLWLVFHNRILFERLFERGRRREYLAWMLLALVVGSLNIVFTLRYGYGFAWPIPVLVKFYLFTLTGLGVYILYRQLTQPQPLNIVVSPDSSASAKPPFTISTDGGQHQVDCDTILYLESLENYVRVITTTTTYLTRLSLKQAEEKLPIDQFLRISRSHIINIQRIVERQGEELLIDKKRLRVGRTYKQYVNERLRQLTIGLV